MKKKKNVQVPTTDLHGLSSLEAESVLEEFLIKAKNNNWKEIKVITGIGKNFVINNLVKKYLAERNYFYKECESKEGGKGALMVEINNYC